MYDPTPPTCPASSLATPTPFPVPATVAFLFFQNPSIFLLRPSACATLPPGTLALLPCRSHLSFPLSVQRHCLTSASQVTCQKQHRSTPPPCHPLSADTLEHWWLSYSRERPACVASRAPRGAWVVQQVIPKQLPNAPSHTGHPWYVGNLPAASLGPKECPTVPFIELVRIR